MDDDDDDDDMTMHQCWRNRVVRFQNTLQPTYISLSTLSWCLFSPYHFDPARSLTSVGRANPLQYYPGQLIPSFCGSAVTVTTTFPAGVFRPPTAVRQSCCPAVLMNQVYIEATRGVSTAPQTLRNWIALSGEYVFIINKINYTEINI